MEAYEVCLIVSVLLLAFFVLLLESGFFKLKDRVDDLEKQNLTLAKNLALFMISTNNRISDISTAFDCCDTNIDILFDEKDKINESITDLKRSAECVNCKLQNPYDSPHLVFFSK